MDRNLYFDEDGKIRILSTDQLRASKALQDHSSSFTSNMQQLQDSVGKFVDAIDQQVERLEKENLSAVGLRNRLAAMHEERRCKQQELQQLLREKQQELERLLVEEQSLLRVRSQQEGLLKKLTDASSYGHQ